LGEESRLRVFENRVLRKVLSLKKKRENWRKRQHEKLYNWHTSPNAIPVTKYKRMRSVCGSTGKYEREQKCMQGYAGETGRNKTTRKA
jgi:hypothetical protein